MSEAAIAVRRPQRWDHPLDPEMTPADVQWLLARPPFSKLDPSRFPKNAALADVLLNDTRLIQYEHGDVIFREGDYGGSAYLLLTGKARIFVSKLSSEQLGRREPERLGWLQALSRIRNRSWIAEVRKTPGESSSEQATGVRESSGEKHVFLQDVDALFKQHQTTMVNTGEIFGELSAINRTPRPFTVVADGKVALLELRWQGLRLLRRDPGFREYLDKLYRENSLMTHLRETKLLRFLPENVLAQVAESIEFESHGELEWFSDFEQAQHLDIQQRVAKEPLIAEEGSAADHLILVRSGFARQSQRQGAGHRTLAYLGRGQIFGLSELAENWRKQRGEVAIPYQQSLRAVGYVDVLKIPRKVLFDLVLPYVRGTEIPPRVTAPRYMPGKPILDSKLDEERSANELPIETGLLEFLVDERLINGRQTMIIDTLRCTRCDDCVRACAATHDGNPRFLRQGPKYGPLMFAHACMHCTDPVCMIGCPTGAINRDQNSGTVSINPETCIGCKTCSESCPYENIKMVEIRDKKGRKIIDEKVGLPILQATKCDLCQSMPSGPACQKACPQDALVRMDMGDLTKLSRWIDRHAA